MNYVGYASWLGALVMLLLWCWFCITRYRWKCVEVTIRKPPMADYRYRVTGITWDGFDFSVHAMIHANFDVSPKVAVKYIAGWAMWSMVEVETIVDTHKNETIYFKDLG